MSKIKNGGLHQYGAKLLEQQQFGTAGVEGVKIKMWYFVLRQTTHGRVFNCTRMIRF